MRTLILGAGAVALLLVGLSPDAHARGGSLTGLSLNKLMHKASQPRLHYKRAIRWQRPFVTKRLARAMVRRASSTRARGKVQSFINRAWVEDRSRPGGTPWFMHAVALDNGPHSQNIVVGDAARQVFQKAGFKVRRGATNGEIHRLRELARGR
jgi:hypothetical protein